MAYDKLVDSTQLDSDLTSVANAIRAKSGGSSQLAFPAGFVSEIGNIPSGGGGTTKSGSITVASRSKDLTIDMGAACDRIIVAQRSGTGNQFGVDSCRYVWLAVGIRNYVTPVNTTASGVLEQVTNNTTGYGTTITNLTCAFNGNSVTFSGTGTAASNIAFSPNVTYDWWAW